VETTQSFEQGVEHLARLFRVEPQLVAHDLHPNYFTTRYALSLPQPRVGVQHHHAHIAACMADNGLENRSLIGLSFDGTGYGTDGAIWGGEVLVADYAGFERAAHLEYLPLAGGDAAVRNPWRIAVGYAQALGLEVSDLPFHRQLEPRDVRLLRAQVEKRLNTVETSSMGRLFDAVAALAGVRSSVTYEAQAAIELEVWSRAYAADADPLPFELETSGGSLLIGLRELLSAVIDALRRGDPAGLVGARFHRTIAAISVEACRRVRSNTGLKEVALSGGVWQNQLLLSLAHAGLRAAGFIVHVHRQTPANDGGLSLGQAIVANHQRGA
jgi:hydrogenase maturation protein HypF